MVNPLRRAWLGCALVAFVLALPALKNGFMLDDHYLVHARTAGDVARAFVEPWGGGAGGEAHARVNAQYFRPLTETLYAVEHALFGEHAWGWHLVSALLHALATALCVLLSARIVRRDDAARIAGLLFAVHPVDRKSVV